MKTERKVWDWRAHVINDGPDSAICKHILLTLSCFMDSTGQSCFPSIKKLVKVTSLSKPTVLKYLKMAEKEGWVKVSKHGYAGQKWARNEYTATLPKAVKGINHLKDKAVKELNEGGKAQDEGGKPHSTRRLTSLATNSSYTSSFNSSKKKYTRDDLLKLYDKYPIQAARGKALPEIRKALLRLSEEDNIEFPFDWLKKKIELFNESNKGKSRYIPYPATWFSEERYLDDPQVWEEKEPDKDIFHSRPKGSNNGDLESARKKFALKNSFQS